MKTKLLSLVSLSLLLSCSLVSLAEYEVQLNLSDKKVYLVSGEQNISVDDVNQYFSGSLIDLGSVISSGTQNTGIQILPVFSGSVYQELGT
ncbi:MAG: hypothetical protein LBH96_04770 [Candidatus Peribacteria bacterium]|nr:hypothetical protein [Candidatus Peribacteria bacterium]